MGASENSPATNCHKNCHKRGIPGTPQNGKSPHANGLWHAGSQASGEGGTLLKLNYVFLAVHFFKDTRDALVIVG